MDIESCERLFRKEISSDRKVLSPFSISSAFIGGSNCSYYSPSVSISRFRSFPFFRRLRADHFVEDAFLRFLVDLLLHVLDVAQERDRLLEAFPF